MRMSKVVDEFIQDCRHRRLSEATIESYESNLRFLIATATVGPGDHIVHFTEALVEQYFAGLVKRGLATSTLVTRRAAIKGLARFCLRKRYVVADPTLNAPEYRTPHRLPRFFTPRERERLMTLTETVRQVERARVGTKSVLEKVRISLPRVETVIRAVLYHAGLRVGTLCRLRLRDLVQDGGERYIRIISKGDREIMVPIVLELWAVLEPYVDECTDLQPNSFLFPNKFGGPIRSRTVQKMVRGWGWAAEVPKATPHRFRHSAAKEFLESGATLEETQGFLGHANIATTQIYRRITNKAVSDAARRRAEMMREEHKP